VEPDDLRDGGDKYSSFAPTTLIAGKPNQTFTAQMLLVSAGPDDPGQVDVAFYASTDTSITRSDYFIGRASRWFSAGAMATIELNVPFPTNIPPGSYYVGWIIDPNNRVAEPNKANNIAYKSAPKLKVVGQYSSAICVDAGAHGTNDGSSWKNAFTSLQDALAVAAPGREIWVAHGVYTPDRGAGITRGDREASFELSKGMTILGGYAGTGAPDPNARDVKVYATILSGDLKSNDLAVADPCNLGKEASRTDNSRHVITAIGTDRTTILDGVQVVGGFANGTTGTTASADTSQGAGLYLGAGALSLHNCTFSGNWAAGDGGAIYMVDSSPELADCTFRANGAGAGVTPSKISGSSDPARGTGGAIRSSGKGQMILSRCKFYSNFAGVQGGALDNDKGSATLTWCLFIQNRAGSSGGGAIWNSEGLLHVAGCTFNGNRSDYSGGAIVNGWSGSLFAADCCLHANYAKVQAGAIEDSFGGKTTLWNCTLAENHQDGKAAAIVCGSSLDQTNSELTVANSILWDGGNEISSQGKSLVTVGHTDIQGGWPGTGNLNANPLFVMPAGLDGIAGTEDDNLRLGAGSPCLDHGDNTLLPQDFADLDGDGDLNETLPLDLDGKQRITGTAVDMGAYEGQASAPTSSSCSGA
jgi:predicted outer membrane repeat protein